MIWRGEWGRVWDARVLKRVSGGNSCLFFDLSHVHITNIKIILKGRQHAAFIRRMTPKNQLGSRTTSDIGMTSAVEHQIITLVTFYEDDILPSFYDWIIVKLFGYSAVTALPRGGGIL